ncbi:MAG: hypothetical protein KDC99_15115 [Cyclobacteriaceae bacterium]|nr:hypothetical protein [Cyclobacteriaceae bacterium]
MKNLKYSLLLVPALLFSCKDDVESLLSAQQNAAIEDQSITEAYFNEAGDLSTKAFNTPSSDQISGGRTRGTITIDVEGDTRFTGSTITLVTDEGSTALSPKGTITIDFGEGQTDSKGTVRKGKILVAYSGLRFVPNSTTVTTFEDYFVNGVQIEGTRTVTSTSLTASPALKVTFTVQDEDGVATFPDETTITRNATHVHTITFGNTIGGTTWAVEGQANGKTRANSNYTFVVNRALLFKTECAFSGFGLPAEGEALFTVDNLPFVINYGDAGAACDNTATITFNSQSQDITVGN